MTVPEPAPFVARSPVEPPREPDIVQLREYVEILRQSWRLIAIAMVAAAIAAGIYAATRAVRYAASAMLVISEKPAAIPDAVTVREVIGSSNFQRELARRMTDAGSSGEDVDLNVDPIPGTRVVRVRALAPDAKRAATAADGAAALVIETDQRISSSQASTELDQIKGQLESARAHRRDAEAALRAFPQIGLQGLPQYDVQRLPSGETAAMPRPPANEPDQGRKLMDLMVELEGEQARLTAAQAQLARVPALDYEVAASRNRVAQLQQQRDTLARLLNVSGSDMERLRQLYAKRLEFSRLQGEFAVADRLAIEMSARYEQARVEVASRKTGLVLIDHAAVPSRPEPRRLVLTVVFGALVAGALATALVLVRATLARA